MAPTFRQRKVIFKGAKGKFVSPTDRYSDKVKAVYVYRGGRYVKVADGAQTPSSLAMVTSRQEFDSLPEAYKFVKEYKPKGKYQAWNLAQQIDETKRIRRKLMKFVVKVKDGKRLRRISFYNYIKANQKRSYQLFKRINEELGTSRLFLYDKIGGKIMADRRGKKVAISSIEAFEVL